MNNARDSRDLTSFFKASTILPLFFFFDADEGIAGDKPVNLPIIALFPSDGCGSLVQLVEQCGSEVKMQNLGNDLRPTMHKI